MIEILQMGRTLLTEAGINFLYKMWSAHDIPKQYYIPYT